VRYNEFAGQNVSIVGLAATGLATARVLSEQGAVITVYESKPENEVSPARIAEARTIPGISLQFGIHEPDWIFTDVVVPSPGVPRYAPSLRSAVEKGIPILSEIEIAYRLAQCPILAITGTNGKTTTTALLGAICREANLDTWVAGNIAEDAGVRLPLIQASAEAPEEAVIVAEISSFQLEWVEQFRPHVAAWLNLSNDHLDRHKDLEEYARAKSNIFRAQEEENFAVINADDPMVLLYSDRVGKGSRWQFSVNGMPEGGDATAYRDVRGNLVMNDGFGSFILMHEREIPIPGKHNIANVLAASAMAFAFGVEPEDIRHGVQGFTGVAHRMELVAEVNGVRYINNSMCTNPAAVTASVSAVGTPLIAIAGGLHKGGDLSEMARSLAKHSRHIVLIGQSAPEIENALRKVGFDTIEIAETLPEAVQKAAQTAEAGDTVMLVPGCASFDMFTGFEHRGQVFREAVKELAG
jgi:UDP-N-acetylmuramoylalanine--D-glutamate ligase